jgi:hypothetical protein
MNDLSCLRVIASDNLTHKISFYSIKIIGNQTFHVYHIWMRWLKINESMNLKFVDCSTSRDMESGRQVLLQFLKILLVNCQFNILRFGSTWKNNYLNGSDLIDSLKWLYNHPLRLSKFRQILLLTGGEMCNIEEAMNLCRKMATHSTGC